MKVRDARIQLKRQRPHRLVACLLLLLLATPLAEQSHAADCEHHDCSVCLTFGGQSVAVSTGCTPLLPAFAVHPARTAPKAPPLRAVADIRSRGPPLA